MQSTLELAELDSKIAQLFIVGMPGAELDEGTRELVGEIGVGGVIFFSRNIQDPLQLAGLCKDLQDLSLSTQDIPLFLAIDQEGGRVARLKHPFTEFPGNELIAQGKSPEEETARFAEITAMEMSLVGLNMNLAPVLDIPRGEPETHLKGRTFGSDPGLVSRLGEIVIEGLQRRGIMAVAKHFPGLGAAKLDPHETSLTIDLSEVELRDTDLKPFESAIKVGVAGAMISHAIYTGLDPGKPATLSSRIINGLLREELGYEGLVLTDDLEMGAIIKRWDVAEAAALAFGAGADLLLVCEDQESVRDAISEIRSLILRGNIPLTRLQGASDRISEAKKRYLESSQPVILAKVEQYFAGRKQA